ncbi:MAG: HAMP domain-containing sensor histidine kinase [Ruminococcus sp.]|nr:HAMP domain-containing sensor histidine kinase [Ruminococcus sp.]
MNERAIKKLRHKFILTATISFVGVMIVLFLIIFSVNVATTMRQISYTFTYLYEHDGEITVDDNINEEELMKEIRPEDRSFFYQTVQDLFNTGFSSTEFIYSIRYFSVTYNSDNQPVKVVSKHMAMVDDTQAVKIADKALKSSDDSGYYDGMMYQKKKVGNNTLVIFVDVSGQIANVRRIGSILVAITLLGSILALIVFRLISGRVIRPEIEAAEQQKRFITNAGHELKTPLAVIRANTELEMMMHGEDEWNRSTMNQVDRMTGLINDLVLVAKAEEQEDKKELSVIDASETVKKAVDDFSSVAEKNGIKLAQEIADGVSLKMNPDLLTQLAVILTDNAVKYCDENGTVTVKLVQKGKGIRLAVSNNYAEGGGVDYSKFFDRFYRKDESHNIDKGGYGIGLSIAEGIVSKYNGSINVSWKDGVITFECKIKG